MMHKLRIAFAVPFAASIYLVAAPADSASFTTFSGGDGAFNDLCVAGSAIGTGNQSCEFAVGELRSGDGAGRAQTEIYIQSPPGNPVDAVNFGWGNGTVYGFLFDYKADGQVLSLSLDGQSALTSSVSGIDLSAVESMFIRVREPATGTVRLTDMALNGTALPDLAPVASGSGSGPGYLQVGGIDWSADWSLTGDMAFTWTTPNIPGGSNLNVNFKLTDLVMPGDNGGQPGVIPLPAAGWLLLSGLAGLGWVGRRRRAA